MTTEERLLALLAELASIHDQTAGQGYTATGYGWVDPACETCGTSDEYAVPWPCATRQKIDALADALPKLLAVVADMRAIRDMEPEPVDESLPDHSDCAECARRRAIPGALSVICDALYRAIARRDQLWEHATRAQQWRMRDIARNSLAALDEEGKR